MIEATPRIAPHEGLEKTEGVGMGALTRLMVDDDISSRVLLKKFIQQYGTAGILEAECAGQALDLLRTQDVDVLITDLKMPDMDGSDFVWCLRRSEDKRLWRLPVVMVSVHDDPDHTGLSRDAGVNGFAAKSCSMNDFHLLVRRAVEEPRTYIDAPGYVGPDRRRKDKGATLARRMGPRRK